MKDAKERADKEAKEMAEELDLEKRGETKDPDKHDKDDAAAAAKNTVVTATTPSTIATPPPQVAGIQQPKILQLPLGAAATPEGKYPSILIQ